MRKLSLLLSIFLFAYFSAPVRSSSDPDVTQGRLDVYTKKGKSLGQSPLKHTRVKTEISGFLARVNVEQEFENNFDQPIEAVYIFPLSQNSAVDKMTMKIGNRTILGKIKQREEARKIYENAKTQGKTASLLDQERANVFTQSVANILPGEKIVIEISYIETLKYQNGAYEFVFPMVVAPRYSPKAMGKDAAAKVTPPVSKTRVGNDISIDVDLDAGVPIENITSTLHEINSEKLTANSAKISLKEEDTIPNRDFVLRYEIAGKRIEDAILAHKDGRGGFFSMMLSPPAEFKVKDVLPKEIIFVLDTSGSMNGFPIEKAKEAMKMSLEGLYPNDTFNLITFAGDTEVLFEKPVIATQANMERALEFLESRNGNGGTEMMKAIEAAFKESDSGEHIRIVNFMTDGLIGNESQIIAEIQKHPNARVFSFGIGDSVNRFLLDKMANEGRGEVEYVTLKDDGSAAAKRFYERIRNPLLTDISIDWNGLPVTDVYPKRNPDLFDAKPVVINGRYLKEATGTIKLRGKAGGKDYEREIKVSFPEGEEKHDVLATLWARQKIDELMSQNYDFEDEEANAKSETVKNITQIGLDFRLMTQFTSFVAVEELIRNEGGKSIRVEVPVDLANGTFSGDEDDNEDGPGEIPNLPAGVTSVTVTKKGAGMARPSLPQVSRTTGDTKRNRSVTPNSGTAKGSGIGSGSGRAVVNTSSAQISTTVTPKSIASLPANSRINSGVSDQSSRVYDNKTGQSLAGLRGSTNVFIIDGAEFSEYENSGRFAVSTFDGTNLQGRTRTVKSPEYPKDAKWSINKGIVKVRVTVDEKGKVSEAKAIEGDPKLLNVSEDAAREWEFEPSRFIGVPLKFCGEIIFDFVNKDSIVLSVDGMRVLPLDVNNRKWISAANKLHFWVFRLIKHTDEGVDKPLRYEDQYVEDDVAKVAIWTNGADQEMLRKLRSLGFEEERSSKNGIRIGKIPVGNILEAQFLDGVKYILPSID
ncbi:MAG: VIT domain-containing protein [Pyrinomonadaceae bacterium]